MDEVDVLLHPLKSVSRPQLVEMSKLSVHGAAGGGGGGGGGGLAVHQFPTQILFFGEKGNLPPKISNFQTFG